MSHRSALIVLGCLIAAACHSAPVDPRERAQVELEAAQARYQSDPTDEDAIVWLGRRLGYVGRYEEAVEVFSRGLELHPQSAWLLRFRGHRFITLRRFEDAVRDLERAEALAAQRPDEVEPDGEPNAAGVPIGTLHSSIDYHLGLALYLRGDFESAHLVYERGAEHARANPDRAVSLGYWYWLTLRRLGRDAEARALLESLDLEAPLLENVDYRDLLACFRGELAPQEVLAAVEPGTTAHATRAYGLGLLRRLEGDPEGARELFHAAQAGPPAAFGHIAAEVELARL